MCVWSEESLSVDCTKSKLKMQGKHLKNSLTVQKRRKNPMCPVGRCQVGVSDIKSSKRISLSEALLSDSPNAPSSSDKHVSLMLNDVAAQNICVNVNSFT